MAYEHLSISENLKAAIGSVSEGELEKFFESLRKSKYQQFATVAKDDLSGLQGEVKMVTELEGIFRGITTLNKQSKAQ